MRLIAPVLALSLFAGAAMAAEPPPEAEAGLNIARQYAKTDKIKFRKVKVGADGAVCGLASVGSDRDIQFLVNVDEQTLWLGEGSAEPNSDFQYGNKITRDTERASYGVWKACQKGK
jgi:hypothetical protein